MTANNSHATVARADAHAPGDVTDYLQLVEAAAPSTPAANRGRLFLDSADGLLKWKDDAGAVSSVIGSSIADILDLPTAETDTTLVLAPDGAGGVEFRAETGGGGGGLTLPAAVQAATAVGGGGLGVMTFDTAPTNGNTVYWISAHNGSGPTSISQTGVTWTQLHGGSVGGVGDFDIWEGVVGSGAGTTATAVGTSGSSQALAIEVAGYAYSALGAGSIFEGITGATTKTTAPLVVPAGRIVCCILHTAGAANASPAMLSCPAIWGDGVGVHAALAFGFTVVAGPVRAFYPTGAIGYDLADIVPV